MNAKEIQRIFIYIIIIGGNLIPFYGLYAWGWDIFSIFFLYWAENAIIGIYTLLMMLIVSIRNGVIEFFGGLFMMAFFCVHYGMFCAGHLVILTGLFGPEDLKAHNTLPEDIIPFLSEAHVQGFYLALAGIAVAQAFQCFDVFMKKYKAAKAAAELMAAPYGRIVVLHLAILLGGFAAMGLGSPVWALAVLIGLKTMYDIAALKSREEDEDKLKVPNEKPSEHPAIPWIRKFVEKRTGRPLAD